VDMAINKAITDNNLSVFIFFLFVYNFYNYHTLTMTG